MNAVVSESLQIVGDELAVTLQDMRLALEQFAEGEGGPNVLDQCIQMLHTIRGVLRMTETYGASLLAEEMEATCQHLGRVRRENAEEALDALSRAAVQLPAYVERILNGGRDIPLVLLPLLNDLRAARGKPLLSESTLLLLNVFGGDGPGPALPEREPNGEDIVEQCRSLRPRFQLALLGWIKGSDADRNLAQMGDIAARLEQAAVLPEVHRLWWVVAAVLESLRDGTLETSVSLKRLMGQTDREIKRLLNIGEERFGAQPPRDLVNNFLYYIARVTDASPRVKEIRTVFNLGELVPGNDQVEAVRESLAAPSAKLMRTVAEAIREDLARVKDVLDIYLRTGMAHPEELVPQVEMLKKIGDTLGVLGLGELREIIGAQRAELDEVATGAVEAQEGRLVSMAAALLSVEHRLDEQLLRLIAPPDEAGQKAAGDDDADYDEVARAVMRECVINLSRVQDAITQVLERPTDGNVLDTVPPLLQGITAGLLILDKAEAVELIEDIQSGIQRLIHQGEEAPDKAALDLLADAIVSLHYYMETLEAGRREPAYMLDNARRCLLALHEAPPAMPQVDGVSTGMATTLQLSEPSATVEALDPRALASLPGIGGREEHPDPEIIELFIEEAGEEIESIQACFARWSDDQGDAEALNTMRRSFHTLKGSGRMVGAGLMGEFSWSIENLLNRLINKTLDMVPEIIDCLGDARNALPELLEQLESGEPVKADIAGLMARAAALAEGRSAVAQEPVDVSGEEETSVPEAQVPAVAGTEESNVEVPAFPPADEIPEEIIAAADEEVAAVTESVAPGIDPVLLDILAKEVGGHLEVIRDFIAECQPGSPPFKVSEALYRACHTLHGSVTMAKADEAATVSGPLNRMIRHAYDHDLGIDETVLTACADAAAMLSSVMGALADASLPMPDTAQLEARLLSLDEDIEQAAAAAAESAAGDTVHTPVLEAEEPAVTADVPAFDADIAGIFAEEAAEILESADAALARLPTADSPDSVLEEMQRYLHTLKGGARMAGLVAMGDLSHDLEALVIGASSGRLAADGELPATLQAVVDELHRMVDQVVQGVAPQPPAALVSRLTALLSGDTEMAEIPAEPADITPPDTVAPITPDISEVEAEDAIEAEADAKAGQVPPSPVEPVMPVLDQIGRLAQDLKGPAQPAEADTLHDLLPPVREPAAAERRQLARVDPEVLQELLNNAGEISIFHSRLMQQMSQIQFNVEELGQTNVRLRDQLRNLELATEAQILYLHQADMAKDEGFDPLELDRYSKIQQLSRALAETASDVNSLKNLLAQLTADTEGLLVQQSRTANELQDGLMRTRMVPFQEHGTRLARLVRQTATEHGKQAELQLEGGGELDRQVLEKMLPPFEHMLRNSVIHGIEAPAERQAAGKDSTGRVVIQLRREGSEVVIQVRDDGRGLNVDAIRQKATDLGLIRTEEQLTDEEVMQFILRSGFSTAGQLTQSAGRGIGMDVVASEIAKLGGTLRMSSDAGAGTLFTIRLPFTLAVTQALIVRAGTELYALPLPTVEGIIRISREEFETYMAADDPAIDYAGQSYSFRHLGQFLGTGPSRLVEEEERVSIILVRAGENSTALITDEMLDSREVVVKPVGAQLATIRGISGATILGDGRVIVILDVGALVRASRPPLEAAEPQVEERPQEPIALVVDDSITMRRVTQRLLERNDFHVFTAKDGVEAIGVLQEQRPDIILLDVEMPRMDGYEFATHVRNNPDTHDVPIIMITSRVSEKHRARAIELGVNDYLGKPYQEQTLMDAVGQLLQLPTE